jgi:hypothetical protein
MFDHSLPEPHPCTPVIPIPRVRVPLAVNEDKKPEPGTVKVHSIEPESSNPFCTVRGTEDGYSAGTPQSLKQQADEQQPATEANCEENSLIPALPSLSPKAIIQPIVRTTAETDKHPLATVIPMIVDVLVPLTLTPPKRPPLGPFPFIPQRFLEASHSMQIPHPIVPFSMLLTTCPHWTGFGPASQPPLQDAMKQLTAKASGKGEPVDSPPPIQSTNHVSTETAEHPQPEPHPCAPAHTNLNAPTPSEDKDKSIAPQVEAESLSLPSTVQEPEGDYSEVTHRPPEQLTNEPRIAAKQSTAEEETRILTPARGPSSPVP